MGLSTGTKLGAYEIVGPLGAGGMGEVYRARDSKLKREVAIKVLPAEFARDPERVARFQREAEILASLNHPHIAAIHDVVESAESRFLVLELVDGETLAERLARGALPLSESLVVAKQITEALEAAHEKGIIHRDLKPANIKITVDGNVKVLDFGLAKVREPSENATGRSSNLSDSPTRMSATTPGMILGTVAYMAPEQAKGQEADRRSDVWSLGCVLYEMLTGRNVFGGATVSEILAEVLKAEPAWDRLPPETPEGIRRLLRRCLHKDPNMRLHDVADVRIEIEEAEHAPPAEGRQSGIRARRGERLVLAAALGLVILLAGAALLRNFQSGPSARVMRLEINTPPTPDLVSFAVAPDGSKIVFVAMSEGRPCLWVRALDSVSMRPLAATDFAQYPFWSPDSRWIGFFADGKLKRLNVDGGTPEVLAEAANPRGGAWSSDDTILFATGTGPIFGIRPNSSEPIALTKLEAGQQTHRFPRVLPGGRYFLYYVLGSPDTRGIYVGAIDGSESRRVLASETAAVYASGRLLFAREGTLLSQDFDLDRLEPRGEAELVAEQVARAPLSIQLPAVSVSDAGIVAYRAGAVGIQRQFVWFDRSGNEIRIAGGSDASGQNGSLSAGERFVTFDRTLAGNVDLWMLDLERGGTARLTSGATIDAYAVFSPDGKRIAFGALRKGAMDIYWKTANEDASDHLLVETTETKSPTDWSQNGRFILYRSTNPKTDYDIWALPLENGKPQKPVLVAGTPFSERDAQFSRDANWIAFESNESGPSNVYVQQFPDRKDKVLISIDGGGAQPRWSPTGNELFYIRLDGRLMAVPVTFTPDGQSINAGKPSPLFVTRIGGALAGNARQQYMVSSDGRRFLMNTIPEGSTAPITVVLNWQPNP